MSDLEWRPGLKPESLVEEAIFPLLEKAYEQGKAEGDPEYLVGSSAGQKQLSVAFNQGATSMSEQISEDYFAGKKTFSRQFVDPYNPDEL
jgi:hypothetical protein